MRKINRFDEEVTGVSCVEVEDSNGNVTLKGLSVFFSNGDEVHCNRGDTRFYKAADLKYDREYLEKEWDGSLGVLTCFFMTAYPAKTRGECTQLAMTKYYKQDPEYVEWSVLDKVSYCRGSQLDELQVLADDKSIGSDEWRVKLSRACKKNKCKKVKAFWLGVLP